MPPNQQPNPQNHAGPPLPPNPNIPGPQQQPQQPYYAQPPYQYPQGVYPQHQEDPGAVLGIVGLALGIFGLPLLGIIPAIIGRNKSRAAGMKGSLATASLWVNIVFLVIYTLLIVFVVIIAAIAPDEPTNNNTSRQIQYQTDTSNPPSTKEL